MALLDIQLVRDLLPQEDLTDEQITAAMRLVAGWLKTATASNALPDALPDDDVLFSPALELVILAVTNLEDLQHLAVGPTTKQWQRAAPGLLQRRDAILEQVRRLRTQPSGDFPCPQPWPDPAYGRTRWWNSSVDDPWGIRS